MSNVVYIGFSKQPPAKISFKDDEKVYDMLLEEERIDIQIILQEFLETWMETKSIKARWFLLQKTAKEIQDRTL